MLVGNFIAQILLIIVSFGLPLALMLPQEGRAVHRSMFQDAEHSWFCAVLVVCLFLCYIALYVLGGIVISQIPQSFPG